MSESLTRGGGGGGGGGGDGGGGSSWHSQQMSKPQFYVSAKRPMVLMKFADLR